MSGWSLVQAPTGVQNSTSGGTSPVVFAAAPTVGNLMVAMLAWNGATNAVPAFTGWQLVANGIAGAKWAVWIKPVVSGDSATVTVPGVAGSTKNSASTAEFNYSGTPFTPSLDGTPAVASDTGTVTTLTAGPTAGLGPNDLLLASLASNATSGTISAISFQSPLATAGTPSNRTALAWGNAADQTSQTKSASWTGSAAAAMMLAAIRPSAGSFEGWGVPC